MNESVVEAYLEGLVVDYNSQLSMFDEFGGVPISFDGLTKIAKYIKTNMGENDLVSWFNSPDAKEYKQYLRDELPSTVHCSRGLRIDPDRYELRRKEFPESDLEQIIRDRSDEGELISCTTDYTITQNFAGKGPRGLWPVVMELEVPVENVVYHHEIVTAQLFNDAGFEGDRLAETVETEKEVMVLWSDSIDFSVVL